ncbi:hypothetical protein ACFQ1E_09985 [Sphingomonas canadensis]|uniref:Circumsporozoite protein n=1 Tax=Sphingomonas canadensis TaxID=1219257 RepID=A0ABW3H964_9SPHN|nr:hypothetical protein [Sphingomonas canadensis]MCW3836551.1 hypothetical protein [Sphingomonas canadensis]
MRKAILIPAAALAALALSACGGARNEANEAAETLAGDSNTMSEADGDVKAATDAAFNDAMGSYSGNTAGLDTSVPDGNEIDE